MAKRNPLACQPRLSGQPLSIAELELGLLEIPADAPIAFWDGHVEAFRDTVVAAMRETAAILGSEDVPQRWRTRLVRQLENMRTYVELADYYLSRRAAEAAGRASRSLN